MYNRGHILESLDQFKRLFDVVELTELGGVWPSEWKINQIHNYLNVVFSFFYFGSSLNFVRYRCFSSSNQGSLFWERI